MKMRQRMDFQKDFQKLQDKVGCALALGIAIDNLDKDFWNELTFEGCLKVCKSTNECEDFMHLHKKAVAKLIKLAKTFDQCIAACEFVNVYRFPPALLTKLNRLAVTFSQRVKVCQEVYPSYEVEHKLCQLATNFDQCLEIWNTTTASHKTAFVLKLIEFTETRDQWLEVCRIYNCCYYDEIKKILLANLNKLATTFDEWLEVYKLHNPEFPYTQELSEAVLAKLVKSAKTFDEWLIIFGLAKKFSKLRETAFNKLKKLYNKKVSKKLA